MSGKGVPSSDANDDIGDSVPEEGERSTSMRQTQMRKPENTHSHSHSQTCMPCMYTRAQSGITASPEVTRMERAAVAREANATAGFKHQK